MIRNDVAIGKNRTGIDLSPIDKQEMLEVTELTVPSMEGDEGVLGEARAEYIEGSETIGTVPPPATVKGVAKTGVSMLEGVDVAVLVDKLGERLAFERTGTRLYGALLDKRGASEPLPNGPTMNDLEKIQAEELAHFEMIRDAMLSLGADPTAVTPSADVAGVASMGIVQVITDARTSFKQSLEAILIAELVDNDGWGLLIHLTRTAGQEELAKRFEKALAEEVEHLVKVRRWVTSGTVAAAKPAAKGTA